MKFSKIQRKILLVLFLFLILIGLLIAIFFVNTQKIDSNVIIQNEILTKDTIRVMSWNIGNWVPGGGVAETPEELQESIASQTARMQRLGNIIKAEGAEIAFIQEINNKPPNPNMNAKIDHYKVLTEHLKSIGWEMYGDLQPYREKPDELHLLILSRYPLDNSTKKFMYDLYSRDKEDGEKQPARTAQTIFVRGTPIGDFRLANIHTHTSNPCNNIKSLYDFYMQYDPERTLLAGDMNVVLNEKPNMSSRKWDDCSPANIKWDDFDLNCTSTPCLDKQRLNKYAPIIDWVFTFSNSELYVKSSYNVGKDMPNASGIADWHPFVIAEVGSKVHSNDATSTPQLPTVVVSPQSMLTPNPSITPEETQDVNIDLDGNTKVDISDFAIFVEYYKVGNVKIDYDEDNISVRDIEDLAYFIEQYKNNKNTDDE
ncbi:endonuclease/exonuclease/phosphatase family protein [Candidatus Dojkabacteria bacterium]|nr:endonuclease/exonuclease/phosphatase family protein [Candidatus Dojkabacteria bacterium]